MEPSAKGAIVLGVVAFVRKLRRSGHFTNEQLSARLSGAALGLLEQKIDIGRWYPMSAFTELVELEWDLVARRNPDHARDSGAKSADHQIESGRYQQLDFAGRTGKAESSRALLMQAKLITTVTASFYSFLQVSVGIDPARPNQLEIVYANSAAFPEPLRYATEGFMNQLNRRRGSPRRWTSERVAADRIVFRLELPERLVR